MAGLTSVGIAMAIGVPLGLAAGFLGGVIDGLISRFTDAMLACPFLILAIAFAAFLGPSLTNAMLAIGITAMPLFIRLTRGQVLSIRAEEYVEAANAVGNPQWRIAVRHILPNILPQLMVQATLTIAAAIIAEASMSFLGQLAAARAVVGFHAEFGATLPRQCAMDGALARHGDFHDGSVVQPAWRRPA